MPFWMRHPLSVGVDGTSDSGLLARVARGEQGALGDIYDRYHGRMMAIGLRILRDRREVEDTLHDVFVEVWRKAGDYDPRRGSVKTWLFMRMRSRSLDRVRSARISRREGLEGIHEGALTPTHAGGAYLGDRSKLAGALESLPEPQRAVLSLGYFEGLSSSEIARALGIPIGTVKSRTAAALSHLRGFFMQGAKAP